MTKISETARTQFVRYVTTRAQYGRCGAARIGMPQLKQLSAAGLIIRGGCGTVAEITDAGEAFLATLL